MTLLLFIALLSSPASADEVPVVDRAEDLACFKPRGPLGLMPSPGCEVVAKTPWNPKPVVYRFNQEGLRDRDFPAQPEKDIVRILLIGPGLDGFGLSEEEMVSRKLQKELANAGIAGIEVINGSIAGFSAPRYAMLAAKLAKAYQPDIVIYNLSGESVMRDYFENGLVEVGEYGDRMAVKHPADILNWPKWAREAAVADSLMYRTAHVIYRSSKVWGLYRQAKDANEEAEKLLAPTFLALEDMQGYFGSSAQVFTAWAPRRANSANFIRGINPFLDFVVRVFTPEISVGGRQMSRILRQRDWPFFYISEEFAQPLENGLVPKENLFALLPNGAQIWARGIVTPVKEELSLLAGGPLRSAHINQFLARAINKSSLEWKSEEPKRRANRKKAKKQRNQ